MVDSPVLFDTCILIDYLRGFSKARLELDRYSDRAISVITWIEVMAGATAGNEADLRDFVLNFYAIPITPQVAERAAAIRRKRGPKLPDAIILATAESAGRILITRNTRDFSVRSRGIRVPYTL